LLIRKKFFLKYCTHMHSVGRVSDWSNDPIRHLKALCTIHSRSINTFLFNFI